MSSVIAIVKSIVGQVLVVSPGGARRVVVEGDRIYQGEQLLTSPNGAVTLDVGKGKLVDLGRDSQWNARDLADAGIVPPPAKSPSVSDLHKAITAGIDPTVELTSTAAGQRAGVATSSSAVGGGSHSFVMLTETAGHVAPTIGYPTAGLSFAAQNVEREVGLEQENLAPEFIDRDGQKAAGSIDLTTQEDTPLNGTFLARDPNGDAFTFYVGDGPQNGQLTVNPDGTWQYVPNPDYNGGDSFTVVVTDSHGSSSTTTVNIGIVPVNDAPVAQPGTATTDENTVLHGQVPPASDVDGHVSSYQVTTGVDNGKGTLTFNPDGSYRFDPGSDFDHLTPGQSQDVTFTYQAKDNDGALSTPQTITITVTGTNDLPVAQPGAATTDEDTVLNSHVPPATDVDGHITGYQLTTDVATGNGTLTFNSDGSYRFDPGSDFDHLTPGQSQDVTFTYQAKDNDGGLSTPQTITITVTGTNDAPVAFPGSATTEENTVLNAQVPAGTDVDGTVVSYQLATDVGSGNGTLTFSPDGSYSFNPGTDFDSLASGETRDVTFTYQAKDNDGALSDPQTITITVTGTNDAAVITGQTTGSTDETNAPVTISGQLTVTDVDSPATFQPQSNVAGTYGHFSLGADGVWTYVASDAYNTLQVGQSLADTFSVQAADGTSSSVTVTINGTNDAPVAFPGSATTEENTVLNAQVPAGTDVDGTVASYQLATDVGSGNGTLTFNPDGSYSFNPGTDFDSLASGEARDVIFTYQAKDNDGALSDPQTITITVTGTNDAAVIAGQTSGSTDETNAPITISGQLTITDVDSPATFQPQSNVAGTYGHFSLGADGTWTYVANDAYNALQVGQSLTDTFSVQAADGTSSSVTVTINGTNDSPVAFPGSATTEENTVLNAQVPAGTDVDGTVASYQLATDVGSGNGTLTFNPDGSYSFNPGTDFDHLAVGQSQEVTFTYQAKDNDGALSDPQTITITVTGTNDAAVITGQTSGSADETNAPVTISGQLTVTDVDSPANFQPQSNVAGTYGHFSLGADGAWTYVANDAYNALQVGQSLTDTFSVQAADGTSSSVTVTINGTNDVPVAYAGTATTEENTVLNAQVPAGTDVDGTVASYQLATDVGSGNGTLTFNPDGSYSFNPGTDFDHLAVGQSQEVTFTYQAKDNDGALSDPQTITITITGSNDAPIATPDLADTKEDTSVQINVLGNDSDPDGDSLTVTSASATNGVVAINPDGTLTYTPKTNFSGTETITYTIADGNGGTASSTVTVTVEAVADQPTLSLSINNSHPTATGLTLESWTGLPLGTSGVGANPATLQSVIDHAGPPNTSHSIDTVYDPAVPVGTANKVSGLIFLEAGHTYTFGGQGDDSIRLVIGGNLIGQSTWGANSGYFNGTFTPGVTGYYTLDLYQHNQNEAGSYILAMSDNGTNAHVISSANTLVYHNTQELVDSGERISDLVGNNGEGYYAAYGMNEGDEDTAIPLSHINAALADTDGSETLSVSIGKIPVGATLSDGTHSFTADATHDSVDVTLWNLNTLTFTPPANANGTMTLEVSATATETSNLDSSTQTQNLIITVHAVNDAPTADATQHLSTTEDTLVSGQMLASDIDGDTLSYALKNSNGPAHGTVTLGSDGHFTYTPTTSYVGSDSFTLAASDNHGGSVEQVVSVDVAAPSAFASPQIQFAMLQATSPATAGSADTEAHSSGSTAPLPAAQPLAGTEPTTALNGQNASYLGKNDGALHDGAGNDVLFGESGNDILLGSSGNDILQGGAGADTFLWHAGDTGAKTISDFNAQEGDRLDLSDLLPDAAHNDILSYLKVDTATSTLQVSTTGHVDSASDVSIKLSGVDLSVYGATSAEIVNKLVAGSDPVVRTEHH